MTLQHVSQHSNHELILHEFLHLLHCTAFVKYFTLVNLMGRVLYGAVLVEPFVHYREHELFNEVKYRHPVVGVS